MLRPLLDCLAVTLKEINQAPLLKLQEQGQLSQLLQGCCWSWRAYRSLEIALFRAKFPLELVLTVSPQTDCAVVRACLLRNLWRGFRQDLQGRSGKEGTDLGAALGSAALVGVRPNSRFIMDMIFGPYHQS